MDDLCTDVWVRSSFKRMSILENELRIKFCLVSHCEWQHDRSRFRAPPMPACRYVEGNSLASMQEVSRCHTRGEFQETCNMHTCAKLQIRLPTLALKPRGDVFRSLKQGCARFGEFWLFCTEQV